MHGQIPSMPLYPNPQNRSSIWILPSLSLPHIPVPLPPPPFPNPQPQIQRDLITPGWSCQLDWTKTSRESYNMSTHHTAPLLAVTIISHIVAFSGTQAANYTKNYLPYLPQAYPHPQDDPGACGMDEKSWICDPHGTINAHIGKESFTMLFYLLPAKPV